MLRLMPVGMGKAFMLVQKTGLMLRPRYLVGPDHW